MPTSNCRVCGSGRNTSSPVNVIVVDGISKLLYLNVCRSTADDRLDRFISRQAVECLPKSVRDLRELKTPTNNKDDASESATNRASLTGLASMLPLSKNLASGSYEG